MRFRLKSPHYIFDRHLEAETEISPKGFKLPGMAAEAPWHLPYQEPLTWRGVPSMEMEPLDDEAKKAFDKKFPSGATPPVERLPLKGAA